MKVTEKIRNLPGKVKKRMQTALILACAVATFAVPAFGGGYTIVKDNPITSSAASVEDIDLLLVGASAFGESRKSMNATDKDAKDIFINNTASLIGSKWQNLGIFLGPRDSITGSTWNVYQNPNGLSGSEVITYNNGTITSAYNKYKAFGFAVQSLNNEAQKSSTTAVSVEEGLDAMSAAAIKLGSFGVEFLNEYNPGPVLIGFYDYSAMRTRYPNNKLVQIVIRNDVLDGIISLFGSTVPGTNFSFFVILNAVLATFFLALGGILVLMGNRSLSDLFRKFLIRIVIGSVGIYVIANFMSWGLQWVNETILDVGESDETRFVEENLNLYDWYLTGFQLPSGVRLTIDANGQFVFTPDIVRSINEYTHDRLVGGSDHSAIKARMESRTKSGNLGTASFVTPSMEIGGEGEGWATDVYYAMMKNYAENKEDLMDDGGDDTSPLHGKSGANPIYQCRYLWMSSLRIDGGSGGWTVEGNGSSSYYGLNPIAAFNLIRSDFSGESIQATSTVYPTIAYVAFDVNTTFTGSASTNMNAITRFIACFTLVLAALKGLITIFTAGFAGIISGGVKTATGSAHGLGQAIGGVIALLFGIIGISVIMSGTLSLLDTVYGIAVELVGDTEVLSAFLQPVQDAVGGWPVIGPLIVSACSSIASMIMTLVMMLTFPKLGGIPITMFSQYMADLPHRIAEKAQMLESQLLSGRGSGGGLGGAHGGSGAYGKRAQAMAGQAFSSSARQAASIVSSGASAAGALAGASLSMAGKALNKKGDAIEGKPENPGVKNWDEMTPEQQAKAAETAANTENWAEMDEDARQQALKDSGVYDEKSTEPTTEQTLEGGGADDTAPVEEISPVQDISDEQSGGSGEEVTGPVGGSLDDGQPAGGIPEVGEEASMNQPGAAGEAAGGDGGAAGAAGKDGAPAGAPKPGEPGFTAPSAPGGEKSISSSTKESTGSGEGSGTGGTVNSTSIKQGDKVDNHNKLDAHNRQENKVDAKSVDAGQHVDASHTSELSGKGTEHTGAPGTPGQSAQGLSQAGQKQSAGQQTGTAPGVSGSISRNGAQAGTKGQNNSLPAGRAGTGTKNVQTSGANATYKSVSQVTQGGGTNVSQVGVSSEQKTQFNASANQKTVNQEGSMAGGSQSPENLSKNGLGMETDQQARKAGDKGAGAQTMNKGTAKSAWGKEMSVKEQRQARAAHALGDALQMAGGNRTLGEGVREAMGHMKDAAVTYATPMEIQESPFMTNLRMRRMEKDRRAEKRNQRRDQNQKK